MIPQEKHNGSRPVTYSSGEIHGFSRLNCAIWLLNSSECFAKATVPTLTATFPASVLLFLYIFAKELSS